VDFINKTELYFQFAISLPSGTRNMVLYEIQLKLRYILVYVFIPLYDRFLIA
jgi:hypothetical protein